jgi:hypothetical protein
MYDSLMVRVRLADKYRDEDPQFKKALGVIEVDIKRTFNQLGYFNQGQFLH